jgi:predicted transcriptional regulator
LRETTLMKPGRSAQVLIPSGLATELQEAADEEHRSAAEVVRDALEGYLEARRWRLSADHEQARARQLGLPDDDVPLTDQHCQIMREKIAQGLCSLREGKGTDGEAFFARMEAEFEELERQGHK